MRKRNASSLHWKGVDILRIRIFIAALLIAALAAQPAFAGSLQESFTFTTTEAYKNYTVSDIGKGELADIPKEKRSRLRIKKASDIKFTVISEDETKEKTYTKLTEKRFQRHIKIRTARSIIFLRRSGARKKESLPPTALTTGERAESRQFRQALALMLPLQERPLRQKEILFLLKRAAKVIQSRLL